MRVIARRGTPAPRGVAAPDRRRRLAHHPVRHQRPRRAHRSARVAAPPASPRRGPHPLPERHRPAQPALHDFAANQIWLELVALANDLLAWTQHLALTGTPARTWEPKRLRLRLLNIAGRIVTTGRRHLLRLPRGWPWTDPLLAGHHRLAVLTA